MHSFLEREWYGVTTPNIISGRGVILLPFGATPPLIGEAEEVVAAEPLGAFNRDPNDPNGIVEQMGVESTSRWGAFLRSVTPDRRPGDYQHAACRILNGIAKRTKTTLQALPLGTAQNGGTFFSFPPSQRSIGMGLTRGGSIILLGVGPW